MNKLFRELFTPVLVLSPKLSSTVRGQYLGGRWEGPRLSNWPPSFLDPPFCRFKHSSNRVSIHSALIAPAVVRHRLCLSIYGYHVFQPLEPFYSDTLLTAVCHDIKKQHCTVDNVERPGNFWSCTICFHRMSAEQN